jgi:hypothetical protein
MLLWQLGSHVSLPRELFVVLPGAEALRIVLVKNHAPVFSRLVHGITQPQDLAAEITRTVRYLENSHLLERTTDFRNVLLLDAQSTQSHWLLQERLNRVPAPAPWKTKPPANWLLALFDQAVASPAGQLAPLSRRTRFVANQLRPPTYAAVGLCLGAGLLVAANNISHITTAYTSSQQIQKRIDHITVQTREVETKISGFGVSADLVRSAVTLEHDEIASAPSLLNHLQKLSEAISTFDIVRLQQLNWRMMPAGQTACSSATALSSGSTTLATEASKPQVEISFDTSLPPTLGEKVRSQTITGLSERLTHLQGATLVVDPAKNLAQSSLSSGGLQDGQSGQSNTKPLSWCLTLPGTAHSSPVTPP